jgi:hypothetical protein
MEDDNELETIDELAVIDEDRDELAIDEERDEDTAGAGHVSVFS